MPFVKVTLVRLLIVGATRPLVKVTLVIWHVPMVLDFVQHKAEEGRGDVLGKESVDINIISLLTQFESLDCFVRHGRYR